MARTVEDVALMLDAGAGAHPDDPLAFDPNVSFAEAAARPAQPTRIAFSPDLGVVPMAREIAATAEGAMKRLDAAGAEVTTEAPDFTGALDAFQTLRATLLGAMMGDMLATERDRINPDIVQNVEKGFAVTPAALFEAERTRHRLQANMAAFFETHDALICPTASIEPFPVETRYVTEIDGVPCETYIDWFAITFAVTLTGCPVVSLPCGLTAAGLPVGVQVIGKPRGEAALLSLAKWIEMALDLPFGAPIDPRPAT